MLVPEGSLHRCQRSCCFSEGFPINRFTRYERDDLLIIAAQLLLVNMLKQTASVQITLKNNAKMNCGQAAEELAPLGRKETCHNTQVATFC